MSDQGSQIGLERVEFVLDGLDHPESVAVGLDGQLYAGGEAGQLYRIDPEGGKSEVIASTGGWILGVALDGEDNLIACDPKRHEVLRCTAAGALAMLSSGSRDRPMETPNYAVFIDDGLLVSDSGRWGEDNGRIYQIDRHGRTTVWNEALTAFPNGLALNGDGTSLYVALSTQPAVWRVPILQDGRADEPELVIELPGTVPDGLAFDIEGGLYIACYRPDRIYRLSPDLRLETVAEDFQGTVVAAPTNVAFGGADMRTLYIASLARWHIGRITVPVPGLRLRYPLLPLWRNRDG